MRVVVQRVSSAKVDIEGRTNAAIGKGLLLLLGIETSDGAEDIDWLVRKIVQLRIFDDSEGVMNLCLTDIEGEALVVSQFTLHASTKKGNRPSYIRAARPEVAIPLYEVFVSMLETQLTKRVGTGVFGANMQVSLVNDGPVTIIFDTRNKDF